MEWCMLGYWGMSCRSIAVILRHYISTAAKQIFIAKWMWSRVCLAWTHWRYPFCCMVCPGVFESQFSCRWKCSRSVSFCDDGRTHPSVVQVGTMLFMEMFTVCYQLYPVLHEFSCSLNETCRLMCFKNVFPVWNLHIMKFPWCMILLAPVHVCVCVCMIKKSTWIVHMSTGILALPIWMRCSHHAM